MRRCAAIVLAVASLSFFASPVSAAGEFQDLVHRDKPVKGHVGAPEGWPSAFTSGPLCEGGSTSANKSCVVLNADGTGMWENDVAPGRRQAPARVTWWLVADQQGTITRVDGENRQTWFILFRLEEQHYYDAPGAMFSFPANLITDGTSRVVVDSKYREF